MRYIVRCRECRKLVNVHVKKRNKIYLKDVCPCLVDESMKEPLNPKDIARIFGRQFRITHNNDGSRTKILR